MCTLLFYFYFPRSRSLCKRLPTFCGSVQFSQASPTFWNLPCRTLGPSMSLTPQNIIIKPVYKGGAVVVRHADLYKAEALLKFQDTAFYCSLSPATPCIITNILFPPLSTTSSPPSVSLPPPLTLFALYTSIPFTPFPKPTSPTTLAGPSSPPVTAPQNWSQNTSTISLPPSGFHLLPHPRLNPCSHTMFFNSFSFTSGSSKLLFILDIKSLYMAIPHNEGLLELQLFLDLWPNLSPSLFLVWPNLFFPSVTSPFVGNFYQ